MVKRLALPVLVRKKTPRRPSDRTSREPLLFSRRYTRGPVPSSRAIARASCQTYSRALSTAFTVALCKAIVSQNLCHISELPLTPLNMPALMTYACQPKPLMLINLNVVRRETRRAFDMGAAMAARLIGLPLKVCVWIPKVHSHADRPKVRFESEYLSA